MSIEIDNVKAKTNTDITNSVAAASVSSLEVGTQINAVADIVELFNNARKGEITTLQTRTTTLETTPVNSTNVVEGTKLFFTEARSIGSLLAGYVKAATVRVIAATDSVLVAIGVLEKRIETNETSIGGALTQLTTTNKSTLIGAINEVNGKTATGITFTAYGGLTTAQKQIQGTVADTTANLTTTAANNTIFPPEWLILFTDGALGSTEKKSNGTTALSALPFGVETDLVAITNPLHFEEKTAGILSLRESFLADYAVDKTRYWMARHDDNVIFNQNTTPFTSSNNTLSSLTPDTAATAGLTALSDMAKVNVVATAITAGSSANIRSSRLIFSGRQGYKIMIRIAISDPALVANAKSFNGMCSISTALSTTSANPSAFAASLVGFGNDSADANLSIFSGPSTLLVKTPLGANFPAQSQDIMILEVDVLPNATSGIYRMKRFDRTSGAQVGATATGTLATASLPAPATLLAPQCYRGNGTDALQFNFYFSRFSIQIP